MKLIYIKSSGPKPIRGVIKHQKNSIKCKYVYRYDGRDPSPSSLCVIRTTVAQIDSLLCLTTWRVQATKVFGCLCLIEKQFDRIDPKVELITKILKNYYPYYTGNLPKVIFWFKKLKVFRSHEGSSCRRIQGFFILRKTRNNVYQAYKRKIMILEQ